MTDAIEALGRQRLLPILRTDTAADAVARAERLAASGLRVLELTATTSGWAQALRALDSGLVLGLGTVTDAATADAAIEAGAAFLVSPWAAPAVRRVAAAAGVPFLEGGQSPGELAAALAHGPAKLFPAHLGGPAYLRSLRPLLPGGRLVPTGGIAPDEVREWLAAGAFAVGIGSALADAPDPGALVREALEGAVA